MVRIEAATAGHEAVPQADADTEADFVVAQMNGAAVSYFRVVAIIFCIFSLVRSINYVLTYTPSAGQILGALAIASAVYGVILLWLHTTGRLPARLVVPALVSIGLLVAVNAFWNMYLNNNPVQLVRLAFVMIVFGMISISIRMWLALMIPTCLMFAAGIYRLDIPVGYHVEVLLFAGLALSLIGYVTRVPSLRRRFELEFRLRQEAEKLKVANAAKDHFVANMTHELRTPMTGVLGMLDLLADTGLTKEQQELLGTAQSSARYLLAIINDILDFATLEAGKVNLRPEPFDAANLTHDLMALLQVQASDKAISLHVEGPAGGALMVVIDPVRVGQVLLNLISNAIKYTERGHVTVRLGIDEADGHQWLSWEVADTGAGIPADRINTLFERFERLDNSVTRKQQGTGLGLAIIRELATLMGGKIEVISEVGVGSVFRFRIPLEVVEGGAVAGQAETIAFSRPLRILLAEDNPVNQVLIEKLMAKAGWSVTTVADGEAALAAAVEGNEPFDVILMDIQMPVMDGVTATRMIRDKMADPPPIIALTANTMPSDVAAYMAAGMAAHVGKPIQVGDLIKAIETSLPHMSKG